MYSNLLQNTICSYNLYFCSHKKKLNRILKSTYSNHHLAIFKSKLIDKNYAINYLKI